MSIEITCPKCAAQNGGDQKFCGNCGASLAKTCSSCGAHNPPSFQFCGECGKSLLASVAEASVEERRWATVLFADMSGFTGASEKMDPEDVRDFADRCTQKLGSIIEKYGGQVEKVVGDEIMAVFGAPVAHEDDPERAVRSGLELHDCVRTFAEEFGGLRLRVGINTGEVMFAPVGPASARRFTVMGDVVNTAARLETAAPIGGVLVGEETYRSSRQSIRFGDLHHVEAKGKEQPVSAWVAMEPITGPAERTVSSGPMVGRDKQLELLESIWRQVASESSPQMVTILGAPGIGKTRLSREFERLIAPEGVLVIRGRSLPYGETGGYGAFSQLVKRAAQIFETDDPEEAQRKLVKTAQSLLGDDADEVVPHLSLMMGFTSQATGDKATLFFAARRFVEGLAKSTPTILIFEDIHWADQILLDLIESLSSRSREVPVLYLCIARPELYDVRPGWGGGLKAYKTIQLETLSAADSLSLVEKLLVSPGKIGAFGKLADIAEGNPLFIEELVASIADQTSDTAAELPTTIRGIIAARIDALPAVARTVLFDASVIGKIFWKGALASFGSNGALDQGLDILESRDFIRRATVSRFQGDQEYSYRHVLLREVAYATVPKALRRERHAAVASFIERTAGERIDEWAVQLAHHFREAGDHAQAVSYLLRAAEVAGRAWAKSEAIKLLESALELVPEEDEERRLNIKLRKLSLTFDYGDFKGTVSEVDDLLPILQGREKIQALILRAKSAFWLSDAEGATFFAGEAVRLVEDTQDIDLKGPARGIATATKAMGGEVKSAIAEAREAASEWIPGTYQSDLASLLSYWGIYEYWVGNFEEAISIEMRSYEIATEERLPEMVVNTGGQAALGMTALGRIEDALSMYEKVVSLGKEVELVPRQTGRVASMWAGTLREIFDIEGSNRMNEMAIELSGIAAFPNTEVQARTDILFLDLLSADYGSVERDLPSVLDKAEQLKGWHEWLVGGRLALVRADLALSLRRWDEANRYAEEAIELATRVGRLKYEALARTVLGESLAATGLHKDSFEQLSRAVAISQRIGYAPALWRSAYSRSKVESSSGRDEEAAQSIKEAFDAIKDFSSGLNPERRQTFENAVQIREILQESPR